MSFSRRSLLVLVAPALAFLASCAAARGYSGPARAKSETALLVGMSPMSPFNLGTTTKVVRVDGVEVADGTKLELLPGTHVLEIYASHTFGQGTRAVTVELEAGVEYLIAMSTDPEQLFVLVPNGER